jgi:hypothetical protein
MLFRFRNAVQVRECCPGLARFVSQNRTNPGRSKSPEPLDQRPSNTGEDIDEGDEPARESSNKEARYAGNRTDGGDCNDRIEPF